MIYGTAWKEMETERLTRLAIDTGFRAIDTANQRRHYHEAGVGAAVAGAIRDGVVRRDDLFLQTKFTYIDGQDHRLPYDRNADAPTQVAQSFASSREHLQTDVIDSYVLHGPSQRRGLGTVDKEVWRAMEELHAAGNVRDLGISNVALGQIEELVAFARVQPACVQNRCFARMRWDARIRELWRVRGITYQGFSLLTANVQDLHRPEFFAIVERVKKTAAQVVFRFAQQVGMLPLTGTTDQRHMKEDLESDQFDLTTDDLRTIEEIAFEATA
jgi:diketogulonate reductase-like aldo/keto reductase